MVHIGGFFMGLKKSHRISNFLLHQIAYFCGQYIKKKPLKYSYFSGFLFMYCPQKYAIWGSVDFSWG